MSKKVELLQEINELVKLFEYTRHTKELLGLKRRYKMLMCEYVSVIDKEKPKSKKCPFDYEINILKK
jgi:hypothetical protein